MGPGTETLKAHQVPADTLHVNSSRQAERSLWLWPAPGSWGEQIKLVSTSPADRTGGGALTEHRDSVAGGNTPMLKLDRCWSGLLSEAGDFQQHRLQQVRYPLQSPGLTEPLGGLHSALLAAASHAVWKTLNSSWNWCTKCKSLRRPE